MHIMTFVHGKFLLFPFILLNLKLNVFFLSKMRCKSKQFTIIFCNPCKIVPPQECFPPMQFTATQLNEPFLCPVLTEYLHDKTFIYAIYPLRRNQLTVSVALDSDRVPSMSKALFAACIPLHIRRLKPCRNVDTLEWRICTIGYVSLSLSVSILRDDMTPPRIEELLGQNSS